MIMPYVYVYMVKDNRSSSVSSYNQDGHKAVYALQCYFDLLAYTAQMSMHQNECIAKANIHISRQPRFTYVHRGLQHLQNGSRRLDLAGEDSPTDATHCLHTEHRQEQCSLNQVQRTQRAEQWHLKWKREMLLRA